ncbi:hypothetical protein AB0O64_33635 [Streptomyces sp. NPDC088341]|uniref:DUF6907 domain-containing protein n=1 Tax=Streptomyces sp. NPDC088341 TaxID=3154870 RepID=UPI0034191B57
MTGIRTVTLQTLDHGQITIPCPDWCVGHNGPPQFRVDTLHNGPDRLLSYGDEPLLFASLSLAPFGGGSHEPGLYVEDAGFARTLDPAEVNELADALVEHATQLRAMARTLATLLAPVDR